MAELRVIEKTPNPCAIEQVEKLLEQLKSGEVVGVVLIRSFNDNCTSHSWAGVSNNSVRLVGELTIAATALAAQVENSRG